MPYEPSLLYSVGVHVRSGSRANLDPLLRPLLLSQPLPTDGRRLTTRCLFEKVKQVSKETPSVGSVGLNEPAKASLIENPTESHAARQGLLQNFHANAERRMMTKKDDHVSWGGMKLKPEFIEKAESAKDARGFKSVASYIRWLIQKDVGMMEDSSRMTEAKVWVSQIEDVCRKLRKTLEPPRGDSLHSSAGET